MKRIILFFFAFIVLSPAAFAQALLVISHGPTFDFGTTSVGETVEAQFTVTNAGNRSAIGISSIGTADPFSFKAGGYPGSGGDCGITLGVGETCELVLTFTPREIGAFAGNIILNYFDGGHAQHSARAIQGSAVSPANIVFEPSRLDFGEMSLGEMAVRLVTLRNTGSAAAEIVYAGGNGPLNFLGGAYPGTGGTCSYTLAAGGSCVMEVQFHAWETGRMDGWGVTLHYGGQMIYLEYSADVADPDPGQEVVELQADFSFEVCPPDPQGTCVYDGELTAIEVPLSPVNNNNFFLRGHWVAVVERYGFRYLGLVTIEKTGSARNIEYLVTLEVIGPRGTVSEAQVVVGSMDDLDAMSAIGYPNDYQNQIIRPILRIDRRGQRATKKQDILFVVDNSASMEFEQKRLSERFNSLFQRISHLDWRIGFVTTDCSRGVHGRCGELLPIQGENTYWIDKSTPSFAEKFRRTVFRSETVDCIVTATCPSGREEALFSAKKSMEQESRGFYRDDANLSFVLLTDEDERSNGGAGATKPDELLELFREKWPHKDLLVNSIIVRPEDAACKEIQDRQTAGILSHYGESAWQLSQMTGGRVENICAADYSNILNNIGLRITEWAGNN